MIRAVAHKPLDLSDEEFEYYISITQAFGHNVFQDTFEVIEDEGSPQYGWITLVTPPLNATIPRNQLLPASKPQWMKFRRSVQMPYHGWQMRFLNWTE